MIKKLIRFIVAPFMILLMFTCYIGLFLFIISAHWLVDDDDNGIIKELSTDYYNDCKWILDWLRFK